MAKRVAHESFDGLRFASADVSGRDLAGASFTECEFLDLAAHDADLRSLDVTRSRLEHVDLRGVELRRLTGLEGLRGATLDPTQVSELAPVFAQHFGIRVGTLGE